MLFVGLKGSDQSHLAASGGGCRSPKLSGLFGGWFEDGVRCPSTERLFFAMLRHVTSKHLPICCGFGADLGRGMKSNCGRSHGMILKWHGDTFLAPRSTDQSSCSSTESSGVAKETLRDRVFRGARVAPVALLCSRPWRSQRSGEWGRLVRGIWGCGLCDSLLLLIMGPEDLLALGFYFRYFMIFHGTMHKGRYCTWIDCWGWDRKMFKDFIPWISTRLFFVQALDRAFTRTCLM